MNQPLPLMSHVSIGTDRLDRAVEFYDRVLGAIGAKRIIEHPGVAVAYGRMFPEFWVQRPFDGQTAERANGVHFAFMAEGPEQVQAFYRAAIEAGAKDEGRPGPRLDYTEAYYGCFVRDPDGHKIEAMSWDERKTNHEAR